MPMPPLALSDVMRRRLLTALAVIGVAVCQISVASAQSATPPATQQSKPRSQGFVDDLLTSVRAWLERAGREYQDDVVGRLSTPTGRGSDAVATASQNVMSPRPTDVAPAQPGFVAAVRDLLGLGRPTPAPTATTTATTAKDPTATQTARVEREVEARRIEQERAAQEQRLATQAQRARELEETATQKRQKIAEAARAAEEDRRKAAQVAIVKPESKSAPQARPISPPPEVVKPADRPVIAQSPAPDRPAVAATPEKANEKSAERTPEKTPATVAETERPTSRSPPIKAAQAAPEPPVTSVRPSPARRTAADATPSDVAAAGETSDAARLARAATKAASQALAIVTRPAGRRATLASASGSHRTERTSHKQKSCRGAGRQVGTPAVYVIKSGDTLWDISRRHYDKGSAFGKIVRANEAKISDPDLIFPCQKLHLPARHALLWRETPDEVDPS